MTRPLHQHPLSCPGPGKKGRLWAAPSSGDTTSLSIPSWEKEREKQAVRAQGIAGAPDTQSVYVLSLQMLKVYIWKKPKRNASY